MLTFATPLAFAAGVKLSVPLSEISGRIKNSASLSVTAEKSSVCVLSFAGPAELKLAHTNSECAPESCATVTSAPLRKRGASLTELRVMGERLRGGRVDAAVRGAAVVGERHRGHPERIGGRGEAQLSAR